MNVLVACEYSGRVREAFRARGHYAWSCDLLPDESGILNQRHLQVDVCEMLTDFYHWDLIVAFPPCTDLAASGGQYWQAKANDGRMAEGMALFMRIAEANSPKIAIENPVGVMSKAWRQADQYVEPFWFGEPWRKKTGLWLKGLPLLRSTKLVEPQGYWHNSGQRSDRPARALNPRHGAFQSAHERSLTFQGIADAMAEQWG